MSKSPRAFRLKEVESDFDKAVIEARKVNPKADASKVLRLMIRKALENESNQLSHEDANKMIAALMDVKKDLSRIGGNLNQIARYFSIHEHLVESDLRQQHTDVQEAFKTLTKVLNEVLNGVGRSTI